jgi:transcriptional regulator with XRE-family HTH domain
VPFFEFISNLDIHQTTNCQFFLTIGSQSGFYWVYSGQTTSKHKIWVSDLDNIHPLQAYLKREGLTYEAFAVAVGVRKLAVIRYINGSRKPAEEIMRRIIRVTAGAVMPNDFYAQEIQTLAAPLPDLRGSNDAPEAGAMSAGPKVACPSGPAGPALTEQVAA